MKKAAVVLLVAALFFCLQQTAFCEEKASVTSVIVEVNNPHGKLVPEKIVNFGLFWLNNLERRGNATFRLVAPDKTILMVCQLSLSSEGKLEGVVTSDNSGGLLAFNITPEVAVCCLFDKDKPWLSGKPVLVIWPNIGRLVCQK
jgi:hypothetical protein